MQRPTDRHDPRSGLAGPLAPALHRTLPGNLRTHDQDEDLRLTRDDPQGSRFQRETAWPEHLRPHADASYQGYGAYATLDGSRVDNAEYADLDWAGPQLEPDRPARATRRDPARRDHTGRGPRGYRRADATIHEEVCERLKDDPDIDASEIEVVVKEGEVWLGGTVEDRELRRFAEDLAWCAVGVTDVHNRLRIAAATDPRRPEDRPTAYDEAKLRDRGTTEEQAERAADRRNLRDHAYTGPRGTSRSERLGET